MKTLTLTIISLFFAMHFFAQNTITDTTLAKKNHKLGDSHYYKSNIDSSNYYYQKAAILYKQIAKTSNDTVMWGKHINALLDISWNFGLQSKFDSSIAVLDNSLALCKKYFGDNNKQIAKIYGGYGIVYSNKSEYDKALEYYLKSLEIMKKQYGENSRNVASSYGNIGNLYIDKAQYDKALMYFLKALNIFEKIYGEKNRLVASCHNSIGIIYKEKNEYDLALKHYLKDLEIIKELVAEENTEMASSYNNIGIVYSDKDEFDLALQFYYKALNIYIKKLGEKNLQVAACFNNIASIYNSKSEYDKSLEFFLKSMEIKKEVLGTTHIDVANSYNNIGVAYLSKKKNDLALQYHFKALNLYKELVGKKHLHVATSNNNIGSVYQSKSEYNKSLKYFLKSLEIRKELLGDKHADVADSYVNIGNVYGIKSQYNKSLEYIFNALKIYEEIFGKKHLKIANSYKHIGTLYSYKSEYNRSLEFYHKAMAASLKSFNDTTDIKSIPAIKDYLVWDDLLVALREKAEIFANSNINLHGIETLARMNLALAHYQAADTLISQVRKNITTKSDKIALGKSANKIYKGAINVSLQLYQLTGNKNYIEQSFYFSEKNKSSVLLEALANAEALQFSGLPDDLLNLEHKLSIDIANYKNLKNNAKNDSLANIWSSRLFKANRSYDSLIVIFERQYPEYYNLKYNSSPATVNQISGLLNKKTVMLSYFVGDSTITIYALSKKDFIVKQVKKPKSFETDIKLFRYNISNLYQLQNDFRNNTHKTISEYQKLAEQFYNLLFPIEIRGLFSKKTKNLIIIPDGQLATIPFECLHTKSHTASWTDWKNTEYFSSMPYLIKDYNISYNYSATLFQQTSHKQKKGTIEPTSLNDWIALAPVFNDENTAGTTTRTRELLTFNKNTDVSTKLRGLLADGRYVAPLPGTEEEIMTIYSLYEKQKKKAMVKTHLKASESFAKSKELQNYKIIHLATHGFVNENTPELSGILFAQDTTASTLADFETMLRPNAQQNEGILYQSEIYNLKFNADLVVLSACETGLGKILEGEGVIGLTRALLYAGTKNIMVSLWQVSDVSTKDLMINFYKNLLNNKKQDKYAKHLSEAKRKMIKNEKFAHPFFWSPFILIGQ